MAASMLYKPVVEAKRVLKGDLKAASKLMRGLEEGQKWAFQELIELLPRTGKAHVVGVTGPAGVGKSTLISHLIELFRAKGKGVGVVLVDPTSPFTGGALLGDRVRMQRHTSDPGVFIRSLATRGNLGGLSLSAWAVVEVMDALGKDLVFLETIGVGQDETDVHHVADTEVVVLTPAQGDDLQMLKAGLFEMGHIFVVNKADLQGAQRTLEALQSILSMRSGEWPPTVILTQAQKGEGVQELASAIEQHRSFLERRVQGQGHRRRLKRGIEKIVEHLLREEIHRLLQRDLGRLTGEVLEGKIDPWTAAQEAIKALKAQVP